MTELLVLPFYVVADVSYSMTQVHPDAGPGGEPSLASLNRIVPVLKDTLDTDPILSDKVLFSLIDFSDDARTQIPLCDLMKVSSDDVPVLEAVPCPCSGWRGWSALHEH